MKSMKLAELASTGAALMSVFHQLFAGNSGSGTGIGPPCVAAAADPQNAAMATVSARRRSMKHYRRLSQPRLRSALWAASSDSEPLPELVPPRAADIQLVSVFETHGVIAARTMDQRVDPIEPHDCRSVDSKEHRRIELLLQRLHALTHRESLVAYMQLGIRPAVGDVVDPRDRNDAHLTARLHRHAIHKLMLRLLLQKTDQPPRPAFHFPNLDRFPPPLQPLHAPLVIKRLEQIVDGRDRECFQCELIECRD